MLLSLPRPTQLIQCFQGAHAALAGFGAAMLVIVGVILPVVLGVQLWRNRERLREPEFALKVC